MAIVYKILAAHEWANALQAGVFHGSAVDVRDGFIHFSDASQVRETAARHFAGQDGLVLAGFEAYALGPALRWEASRGGASFPHLYVPLNPALAVSVAPLAWDHGAHRFPPGFDR
jgi:uncharacterized protein (DUF952 family)